MSFISLGLSDYLLTALSDLGYTKPTPIQEKSIPAVLAGHDVLAAAETGSGKTAGFSLPVLQKLQSQPIRARNKVSALVLVPTRELAVQVTDSIVQYARNCPDGVKAVAVYGGVAINPQMQAMRGGCDILVATPGRLIDLVSRNAIQLDAVSVLILDEADRMLGLGFAEELAAIFEHLPEKRQNLLFSATFPDDVRELVQALLVNPVEIDAERESMIPEKLHQRAIEVNKDQRTALLKHLLQHDNWDRVLVFVASQRTADNLEKKLFRSGLKSETLHGGMGQAERNLALEKFKTGKSSILIATDLAARGIDIPELPCVINYDLPRSPADYVHRIGRTARAGEQGQTLAFIDHESDAHFKLIEKRHQIRIPREQIPGFERNTDIPEHILTKKGQAPVKGKRKSKKDKLREAAAAEKRTKHIWAGKP
ncbi:DEAD/DEAH box helicase [Oceanospirillum sp. D5]|uniref:DEAD-box ATP-dependent RNA helicase RhpA n=2 Tax=Oceanospirillum sediminis TaxID=2760088 RepID=A0A839IUV6_9GAMM|nr:DEAD/DEAH box helicase [Oceanospirillum sediminis]